MNLDEKSSLAGIKLRHLRKVVRFYDTIEPINSELVYNLFCGNALASWYILNANEKIKFISVDKIKTEKYSRLESLMEDSLKERHLFLEQDIGMYLESFVISIHPCGNLADRIILACIEQGVSFAIVPCCYKPGRQLLKPKNYIRPLGLYRIEIIDDMRIKYLRENKRDVVVKRIENFPSPMNKLIMSHI